MAGITDGISALADHVEVRRSGRRRSTVSAYRDGDRVVVLLPARLSAAESDRWVQKMVAKLAAAEHRRQPSDDELLERARILVDRYLREAPQPTSVRWVDNQNTRWGSCTPADGTVRLSMRLRGLPQWVQDYVLMHELCHLVEDGHTAVFWELVARYPRAERARGFLQGVSASQSS